MPRGGKRPNAGRPKGRGPYGEATKPIRIPLSLLEAVKGYILTKGHSLPFFSSKVRAGFPSPADDYQESTLSLDQDLILNPVSTFFLEVAGDSMVDAGIKEGDRLVVDKSLTAKTGDIVIALVDGEFTVKTLKIENKQITLIPENANYAPITIKKDQTCEIWGVVTAVIRKLKHH